MSVEVSIRFVFELSMATSEHWIDMIVMFRESSNFLSEHSKIMKVVYTENASRQCLLELNLHDKCIGVYVNEKVK